MKKSTLTAAKKCQVLKVLKGVQRFLVTSLPSNRSCDTTSGSVSNTHIDWTFRLAVHHEGITDNSTTFVKTRRLQRENKTFQPFSPYTDTQWTLQVLRLTVGTLFVYFVCHNTDIFFGKLKQG